MTEIERLVKELAELDPIVNDPEDPNYCFFCDAEAKYFLHKNRECNHENDCLWKRAQEIKL